MKFLRSGAIYALANIASAAVPFLLLPLLTRVLGPAEYGQVIAFALLVMLCQAVAGLNAHAALGVVWFQRPHEEMPAFIGTAVTLAIASTLLLAPVVALLLWRWPGLGGGLSPVWGAVAALTAGTNVLLLCRLVLWQSQRKPLQSSSLQVGSSLLNVGLSLLAVLGFSWGGDGRNLGIAAASALLAAIALLCFHRAGQLRWAPDRAQLKTLAAFGLPLIVHTLASVLLVAADRWTVSIRLDAETLGIYGAGAQLGMVMGVLGDAFVKAYSPWMYDKLRSGQSDDRHCAVGAVYVALLAFVCLGVVVWALLHAATPLLLGPQFRAATEVLPWFILGGVFGGIYLCTSGLYFFSGRTSLLASLTMSSALVGATATWYLVGAFGVHGAAIGFALTQAVRTLLTTGVAMHSFDLPWASPARSLGVWLRGTSGGSVSRSA